MYCHPLMHLLEYVYNVNVLIADILLALIGLAFIRNSKQAYFGDASSVQDHSNKTNNTIKQITLFFWFSSTYKSYIYTCTIIKVCNNTWLKIMSYLITNTLLLKNVNYHQSFSQL